MTTNSITSWFQRLARRDHSQYLPVANNDTVVNRLPGGFPNEDIGIEEGRSKSNQWWPKIQDSMVNGSRWINYIIIKVFMITTLIVVRSISILFNVMYFKDHYPRPRSASSPTNYDPIDKANKFVRELEDQLLPDLLNVDPSIRLPPFYQGSYSQALYMATQRGKFLFVYLSTLQNENGSSIFNKIITNGEFIKMIKNTPNVIIWGGCVTDLEAYQVANSLNVTKFPFLGLLCLTRTTTMSPQGPVKTPARISLVLKIQGNLRDQTDIESLIRNKFTKRIEKYESELSLIRNELSDKFMSQVLLKQQDLKYQQSLAQDRLKKKEKEYQKLKKKYLRYKADTFLKLKNNTCASNGDTARVAIKMSDGSRQTVFFPSHFKVEDVFLYVELLSHGLLDEDTHNSIDLVMSDEEAQQIFKDFKMRYEFKLKSSVPPFADLSHQMSDVISSVNSIYPSGLLLMEE